MEIGKQQLHFKYISKSHWLLSQFPTEGIFFPRVSKCKKGPISLRKMLKTPAPGIDLSGAPVVNTSKQTCALLKLCFKVWQNRTLISRDVLSAWKTTHTTFDEADGDEIKNPKEFHCLFIPWSNHLHYIIIHLPLNRTCLVTALGQASHQGKQLYKIQYRDLGPGEKQWRGGEETQTNQALETTERKSEWKDDYSVIEETLQLSGKEI